MIRTLHFYISRELAKVTLLALVAFTLVLTVIAIIEPLRKQQGLAAEQVLALFGYLLPVMLSLTLPIGAMFAATIVYGKFSQDNELLACRASGISTGNLLRPALVLGLIVTASSLVLNNFVAPRMVAGSKAAIEQNIRGVTYRQLRSRSYVKWGSKIIHADSVDEKHNILRGVVYAEPTAKKEGDVSVIDVKGVVASKAAVDFSQVGEEPYVYVVGTNPRAFNTGNKVSLGEASQELILPFDNPVQERAAMMDWDRMIDAIYSPYSSPSIARSLDAIKRDILHDALACQVADVIAQGKPYRDLVREVALPGMKTVRERYVITAVSAKVVTDKTQHPRKYYAQLAGDKNKGVRVDILRDGRLEQSYTGPDAIIGASWSGYLTGTSQVNLTLHGPVTRTGPTDTQPERREIFEVGQLPIPKPVQDAVNAIGTEEIYRNGGNCTKNPLILEDINAVVNRDTRSLLNEIKAEMHCRVAYSLSCFLLVSVGAALGLMFRGGQFISAFAIGAIPGAIVIIMIFAGKNMMENSKVNNVYGLVAIWGGMAILLLGNLIVYGKLVRR